VDEPLLERERELEELRRALADARQGRGRVVLVEGVAGLGKTSLLRSALEAAREDGFTCLRARASELERAFAYGCVRQLLEPAVARDADRSRVFAGAAALAEPLFAPTGAALPAPSLDSSFAMLHGLYWMIDNLAAETPVVLVVDDLQWADPESQRLLEHLTPRIDGLPLAVLASTRTGEATAGALARFAAAPETTVVRPMPLSLEGCAALCERRLNATVAPEFAAACREATGGVPFYIEALLREAAAQRIAPDAGEAERVRAIGPSAVARTVLLRLSGTPPEVTRLVRAVAMLGDGVGVPVAAALAEITERDAARAADILAGLAILGPAEGLEFAHPIVREAVYADIGPRERATAHARAASLLAVAGASEERIAAQLVATDPAGDPERVALLRRVAAGALARGGPAGAVAWLRRALAEPPPDAALAEVLMELGTAEAYLGAPEAIEHLAAAAKWLTDATQRTGATRMLALALTMAGESDHAVAVLEAAIPEVDREHALMLEADLDAHAQQASLSARAPAARRLEAHSGLTGATPGERLVLAALAFERARASTSAAEAAAHLVEALDEGRLLRDPMVDVAGVLYQLVLGLLETDAFEIADRWLAQEVTAARARASIPALAYATLYRGLFAFQRGRLAEAEADARTGRDLLASHGIRLGLRGALALLVLALIESGDADAAERELRDGGFGDDIPPGLTLNGLLEARARVHLAGGRLQQAVDDLVEFGRRDELWGSASPLASRWRSRAAVALAALGQATEARALAGEDLERARRWGAASGLGIALRAAALTGDEPIGGLREAVDVLATSPARLEHARALVDLGAALRRANRRADARAELQAGLQLAEVCGAHGLAEHARTELLAAGGRSSEPEGAGLEQLTVSERRVAELAAEGRSNPEIAQALFVTRKTVETHLGRVYRKLDLSGRADLGGMLDAG
jgi:DNA-binding CsgD family transcriptional regulator